MRLTAKDMIFLGIRQNHFSSLSSAQDYVMKHNLILELKAADPKGKNILIRRPPEHGWISAQEWAFNYEQKLKREVEQANSRFKSLGIDSAPKSSSVCVWNYEMFSKLENVDIEDAVGYSILTLMLQFPDARYYLINQYGGSKYITSDTDDIIDAASDFISYLKTEGKL